jgi:3-isopropylmalate/(R)-2-methylmalate dehydratase small subunit
MLPNGPALHFDIDPYRKRALLLGLDEVGSILADDAADIDAYEQRQRQQQPWVQLDSATLARVFPKPSEPE